MQNLHICCRPTRNLLPSLGSCRGRQATEFLNITKDLVLHAAILEKNENFKKLPEETKRAALNTMFYKPANGGLDAGNGTNAVTELVTDPNFGKLTPKQQDQFLEIVRANPGNRHTSNDGSSDG